MTDRTKVLIVDDHQVIAEGLALLIGANEDLEVAGVAHDAAGALALARTARPDVILLDHYLPDRTGAEVTVDLKKLLPDAAVVVLTSDSSENVLLAAFEAGAAGYLLKTKAAAQVLEAIRHAAAGETLVTRGTLERVLRSQARDVPAQGAPHLTERERDVLRAMAEGASTQAIAERFSLTIATTRTYVQSVLRKLESHSRLQAVVRAGRQGLLG